ncbi:hypothetical protein ACPV4B_19195 [Vibrio parahaemolyticus]
MRGYYATFSITHSRLYLRDLCVCHENGHFPVIDEVQPTVEGNIATYRNLKLPIDYTGILTLLNEDIDDLLQLGSIPSKERMMELTQEINVQLSLGQIISVRKSQESRQ